MRIAVAIAVAAVSLVLSPPAGAQAKDPFRPPPGVGVADQPETAPGGPAGGVGGEVPPPHPSGGGLPRTGLDYSVPVLLALVLMAGGASLRLIVAASAR